MKKTISIIAILCLLLTLVAGCSQKAPEGTNGEGDQAGQPPAKAEYVIKICTATTGDAQARVLETFKKYVEKESNGRIEVQTYPSGQMGSSEQVHQLLLSGAVQAVYEPSMFMTGFLDAVTILDFPHLFDFNKVTLEELQAILNGPVGDPLRAAAEEKGLLLTIQPIATRNVLTKFDITSLNDLSKKKIRTGSKVLQDQWAALGAVGVPMSVPELYTALQQGAIDGLESNLTFFYNGKYTEVAKYYLDDPLGLMTSLCLLNKAFIESLPEDLAKIVKGAPMAIQNDYLADFWADNERTIDLVQKDGVKIVPVSQEMHEKMMELTRPVHEKALKDNPALRPVYEALMAEIEKLDK